jgi:hypothetical protein
MQSMLSKTKHSIAVAAVILAASSPTALAADGSPGDSGAPPAPESSQSSQAAQGGGQSWSGARRHCWRVRYSGGYRWHCGWRA